MTQSADLNEKLANDYIHLLHDRDIDHRRIILTFSGIPGSGKTTLARNLAADLQAQYIQHDQIRQMITDEGYNPRDFSIGVVSHAVIARIMTSDRNKFVVLDASLDRTWSTFFGHVQEWGIQPIVIRLNVPYDVVKQRLQIRDGPDRELLEEFDKFVSQFENCKNQVVTDFELQADYNYDELLTKLVAMTK